MDIEVVLIPIESIEKTLEKIYNDPELKLLEKEKITKKIGKEDHVYYLLTIQHKKSGWFYP